jgi:DNA-binding IclR family transcriptional regulator
MENEAKVKSLYKAIKLLDCFTYENPEWGISELAKKTELLKSTVHNIISTYELCGIVEKNPKNGKYRLGYRCMQFGNIYRNTNGVIMSIHPVLEELSAQTEETVYLAFIRDNSVTYLDSVSFKKTHILPAAIGETAPVHCTGIGKAILAYMPADKFEAIISKKLEAYTPNTITDPAALSEEFLKIRTRGYAVDNMEHEYGITCVAAPVLSKNGEPLMGISISGPSLRFSEEKILRYSEILKNYAEKIRHIADRE